MDHDEEDVMTMVDKITTNDDVMTRPHPRKVETETQPGTKPANTMVQLLQSCRQNPLLAQFIEWGKDNGLALDQSTFGQKQDEFPLKDVVQFDRWLRDHGHQQMDADLISKAKDDVLLVLEDVKEFAQNTSYFEEFIQSRASIKITSPDILQEHVDSWASPEIPLQDQLYDLVDFSEYAKKKGDDGIDQDIHGIAVIFDLTLKKAPAGEDHTTEKAPTGEGESIEAPNLTSKKTSAGEDTTTQTQTEKAPTGEGDVIEAQAQTEVTKNVDLTTDDIEADDADVEVEVEAEDGGDTDTTECETNINFEYPAPPSADHPRLKCILKSAAKAIP